MGWWFGIGSGSWIWCLRVGGWGRRGVCEEGRWGWVGGMYTGRLHVLFCRPMTIPGSRLAQNLGIFQSSVCRRSQRPAGSQSSKGRRCIASGLISSSRGQSWLHAPFTYFVPQFSSRPPPRQNHLNNIIRIPSQLAQSRTHLRLNRLHLLLSPQLRVVKSAMPRELSR